MKQSALVARRKVLAWLGGSLLGAVNPLSAAVAGEALGSLSSFRLVQQDSVRLHFDLDRATADANLFILTDPDRLVIDLPDTALNSALREQNYSDGVVKAVRYGIHDGRKLRIVVDLRRPVSPNFRFIDRHGGQRLLIDLGVKGNPMLADYSHRVVEQSPLRDVIVAIDAGHGGKDSGAIGQRKTREKDITLKVARRLYKRLSARRGITPIMIRDADTYIGLRERMKMARERHADLFVSIHADAFLRKAAKGSSVFTLSMQGASSEAAQWLADKETENAALFGDVALDGLSKDLKSTLLDLAQNSTLESSMDVGAEVLAQLKQIGAVHKPHVEQANFAVLKSPDIPSVLVETAFISNLREEKKLNTAGFQNKLAVAIETGITAYLQRRAPPGTLLYQMRRNAG